MRVATTTGSSEVRQARIDHELATQLRADSEVLGPNGRTDIVRSALRLLHQRAAEERMARSVDDFYADQSPPPQAPRCRSACDPRQLPPPAMPGPEPFCGEVWDVDFPDVGTHPAVVLSANPLDSRLGHVAVVPVTGTPGPPATHVPLTADAGLTRYPESYADVTAPP